jgi:hypothetical protein
VPAPYDGVSVGTGEKISADVDHEMLKPWPCMDASDVKTMYIAPEDAIMDCGRSLPESDASRGKLSDNPSYTFNRS